MIEAESLLNKFILGDCMQYLPELPDNFFDLAIVDPVYGINVDRSKEAGKYIGTGKGKNKDYHAALWSQEKTGADYFKELLRVSKNSIIWGGTTSPIICRRLNVGLYGIKCTRRRDHSRTRSLHGRALTEQPAYFAICGTACFKAT